MTINGVIHVLSGLVNSFTGGYVASLLDPNYLVERSSFPIGYDLICNAQLLVSANIATAEDRMVLPPLPGGFCELAVTDAATRAGIFKLLTMKIDLIESGVEAEYEGRDILLK